MKSLKKIEINYLGFLKLWHTSTQLHNCEAHSSVQSLSRVQLFMTPWTTAHQVSLSIITPGAYSNSCPSSQWCHPTISSSVAPFSSYLQFFPSIRVFSSDSVLCIKWPKHWSFSSSPSNEYSGMIFFRMDWLDLLAAQGTLKSLL